MADPKTPETPKDGPKAMTAADAAKRVRRVVVDDEGKATQKSVKADEVMAFRDYGTHVVVVTTSGEKLSSAAVASEA